MSDAGPAKNRAETLIHFCKKIGINDVAEIKKSEAVHRVHLIKTLPAENLKGASVNDYDDLMKGFGESLDLEIVWSIGQDDDSPSSLIQIVRGNVNGSLAQGIADLNNGATELKITINIAKAGVVKLLGLDETRCRSLFYLFEQNLENLLSAPLLELDEVLFGGAAAADPAAGDRPLVIVVADADIYFAGEMLIIVGESQLDEAKRELKPLDEKMQLQIKEYRKAAVDYPSLVGQKFERLTPLHFVGKWKRKGPTQLENILARHFVNMCILCTASRSTFTDRNPAESVYDSAERTATLGLAAAPVDPIKTDSADSLARWLYSGKGTDQRTVFQNIVARELYSDDPVTNYNTFVSRLGHLLQQATWHYQVFVDGKITKHFEQIQKVVGYVADMNKRISETVDSVTKGLTDALLATVGVLVLTVLAALVKKETSVEIFRINMQIYAAYLGFYAAYRMVSIFHSYRLLIKDASMQLVEYRTALGEKKIDDLSRPLTRRRRQFHIWFWITVGLYLALAGLILWAGYKGPQLLIDWGIISPAQTQTPKP